MSAPVAIEPYDPDSPIGREVAANLTRVLDDLRIKVQARTAATRAVGCGELAPASADHRSAKVADRSHSDRPIRRARAA